MMYLPVIQMQKYLSVGTLLSYCVHIVSGWGVRHSIGNETGRLCSNESSPSRSRGEDNSIGQLLNCTGMKHRRPHGGYDATFNHPSSFAATYSTTALAVKISGMKYGIRFSKS